jgi:hypothetical protein
MTPTPALAILIGANRIRSETVSLTPDQEREWIIQLVKMGPTQARSDMDHGRISPAYVSLTAEWLADREREAERRSEASQSEQIELMRRASAAAERQARAAERANTRATVALVIAIVSMIVTVISILITHWDAHK